MNFKRTNVRLAEESGCDWVDEEPEIYGVWKGHHVRVADDGTSSEVGES
jgi:hypothetical protein